MKHLFTLSIALFAFLSATAQLSWRQLPPNTNAASSDIDAYDVAAGSDGSFYMIYAVMNTSTDNYDIIFDKYTVADGWNTIATEPTSNNSSQIDVKTVQIGSGIYVMGSTGPGDHLSLYEISGDDVSELENQNFPSFNSSLYWDVFPGTAEAEVYFTYSNKLYKYNLAASNWTNAGNPFSGSGVTPYFIRGYSTQDSVFLAGKFVQSGTEKLRIRKAAKSNWTWSNYSGGNGNLYSMNGAVADTISGLGNYFIFGNQQHTMGLVAYDNNVPETFMASAGSYGTSASFPLNYDLEAIMSSSAANTYVMAEASNLSAPNVVWKRNFTNATWSPYVTSEYAPGTTAISKKRMEVNPLSDRMVVGYIDDATADYIVKTTNNAPTVFSPGTASNDICANTLADLIAAMQIQDLDDDDITLLNVLSTNAAVINPANINATIYDSSVDIAQVYIEGLIGDVATDTEVTLTFNFTDGFDVVSYDVTYTIHPNAAASFSQDSIALCGNGDAIDLIDYISEGGGTFSVNGTPFEDHYFDPTDYEATDYPVQVVYSLGTGTCVSTDTLTITYLEAPVASITAVPTTNCVLNDGSATLTITNGTGPYQFAWSVGNHTDLQVTGLSPGSVHADIIDANGCLTVADAIVPNTPVTITGAITPITCHGAANGAIDMTITGMTGSYSILWSNGHSAEDLTGLQPGNHQVWLTDAAGCVVSQSFDVPEPDELEVLLDGSNTECQGASGNVSVEEISGGTDPYTYEWSNGSTADNISDLASGIYTLTVTDANGCTTTAPYAISDNGAPYAENAVITGANCGQSNGTILVDLTENGTNPVFEWSSGQNDTSYVEGLGAGTYTLHGTNDEGCNSYGIYEVGLVSPERQQICIVTVDSATTTNLVVWQKNGDPTIDHYNIYRETMVAGQFQLIDTVSDAGLSLFNDVIASPLIRSWKYRISAVDVCGTESQASTAHKTIHLVTNDDGNGSFTVNWNFYQGYNAPNYHFYRHTSTDGWIEITTTPASLNYFTDTPPVPSDPELDYMVDFDLASTCSADYEKSHDFNTSRSNKDRGQFTAGEGTGDSSNGLIEMSIGSGTVILYPNPVNGETVFIALSGISGADYSIVNLTGQQVTEGSVVEGTSAISTQQLPAGVYIMHLHTDRAQTAIRFVVR